MRLILSQQAQQDLNNIFNYSVYLYKDVLCHTFVAYFLDILRAIDLIREDVVNNKKIYSKIELLDITVDCSVVSEKHTQVLMIKNIRYKNFNRMIQLCRYERQGQSKRTKFKLRLSTKNPDDYKHIPNGQCGEINGEPIYIVQRKSESLNNNYFNYLHKGNILSKYDFISCFSFVNENNEYKSRAAAGRTNWYWVYPTGKLKKISSKIVPEALECDELSDDEFCKILLECADEHWHNLFR